MARKILLFDASEPPVLFASYSDFKREFVIRDYQFLGPGLSTLLARQGQPPPAKLMTWRDLPERER